MLIWAAPMLYESYEFARSGQTVQGWYVDLHGAGANMLYAYTVNGVTYGGTESLNDQNSEIIFRNPGDPVWVSYLPSKPWRSTVRRVWDSSDAKLASEIFLTPFFISVLLCFVPRRRHSEYPAREAFQPE